jgi:hypothetical protein
MCPGKMCPGNCSHEDGSTADSKFQSIDSVHGRNDRASVLSRAIEKDSLFSEGESFLKPADNMVVSLTDPV